MADMLIPKNQTLNIKRYEYRLVYEKRGRARYISHLDLVRAMQRVFKRAGIPLWYTQGFNPHAYLMFPLALPLGTDSSVEILDIALTEPLDNAELKKRINEKMPQGLSIIKVGEPIMKHTMIAAAEYEITAVCSCAPDDALAAFENFISRDRIEIEKRSKKKGVNLVDIKPRITVAAAQVRGNALFLRLILPAGGEFNLNTSAVMNAFCDIMGIEITSICTERTKIMTSSGEIFI